MITPVNDIELYSDAELNEPCSVYKKQREFGSTVYLSQHNLYIVACYPICQRLQAIRSRFIARIRKLRNLC